MPQYTSSICVAIIVFFKLQPTGQRYNRTALSGESDIVDIVNPRDIPCTDLPNCCLEGLKAER